MKAIILAAGMGTRLGYLTENLPKCMLSFNGKTLIERQVETLRSCGIHDITIVKGYMSDVLDVNGTKTYVNDNYGSTNMVETLFCAEKEMDGGLSDGLLVCYSDVIYEQRVLKKILQSSAKIGVVVDEDYQDYWQARSDRPEDDVESMVVENGLISQLGDTSCSWEEAQMRYVGLIKFSKEGIERLKEVYYYNRKHFFKSDASWLRSKNFRKAYMTCMLQAIINSGFAVKPILIRRGWLEFDTIEDYNRATSWVSNGAIRRFIDLDAC